LIIEALIILFAGGSGLNAFMHGMEAPRLGLPYLPGSPGLTGLIHPS
jgi:hypothetical protein